MKRIVLKKGRDKPTRCAHPWIFSGAIERVEGDIAPGEIAEVASANGERLGAGAYSPASDIRVRMVSGRPGDLVRASVARRAGFFRNDSRTTAFRLVHAESDGVPGVVADWYDGFIAIQLTSAWAERNKGEIVEALAATPGAKGVWNRSDVAIRGKEGLSLAAEDTTGLLAGDEPPELVEIREGTMRLFVDIRNGHKTGYYLDQRDARAEVGAIAAGRRVLNAFSYTGGFAVAAALGGAREAVNVDVSEDALALAARNAELNGVGGKIANAKADVFLELRRLRDAGKQFDMIVLDPPKFADSKARLMKAMRGYKDINLLAMKLLSPGGILATFSCSGAMTRELFDTVLREAAHDAGRTIRIISRTRQGEDHPVDLAFPEGEYLKGAICRFDALPK